jgi:hypothetical protein
MERPVHVLKNNFFTQKKVYKNKFKWEKQEIYEGLRNTIKRKIQNGQRT